MSDLFLGLDCSTQSLTAILIDFTSKKIVHRYIYIKSWSEIIKRFNKFSKSIVNNPEKKYKELYNDLLKVYKKCEDFVLKNGEDPELLRKQFINVYF